jgi:hypothetical protein
MRRDLEDWSKRIEREQKERERNALKAYGERFEQWEFRRKVGEFQTKYGVPPSEIDSRRLRQEARRAWLEEEAEYLWQRDQERQREQEQFSKLPFAQLESLRLKRLRETEENLSNRYRGGGDGVIDYRGILFLLMIILAWFWFNRPVQRNVDSHPNIVQPTQTVRQVKR